MPPEPQPLDFGNTQRPNTAHQTYKNAYFQDTNNNKMKKNAFFDDSDDERGPRPGLFDDSDDDILQIDDFKNNNNNKNNETHQNTQSLSSDHNKSKSNDEILYITPTNSKNSLSNIDDPLLKDLDKDDALIATKSIFDDDKSSKHSKNDSKILVNGKDIKLLNPKQSALEFKQSETDDPLKNTPNNPWKSYFNDWEIWNRSMFFLVWYFFCFLPLGN